VEFSIFDLRFSISGKGWHIITSLRFWCLGKKKIGIFDSRFAISERAGEDRGRVVNAHDLPLFVLRERIAA
jgi:hypothetical protein